MRYVMIPLLLLAWLRQPERWRRPRSDGAVTAAPSGICATCVTYATSQPPRRDGAGGGCRWVVSVGSHALEVDAARTRRSTILSRFAHSPAQAPSLRFRVVPSTPRACRRVIRRRGWASVGRWTRLSALRARFCSKRIASEAGGSQRGTPNESAPRQPLGGLDVVELVVPSGADLGTSHLQDAR